MGTISRRQYMTQFKDIDYNALCFQTCNIVGLTD
jgi:hypothetical protein